MPHELLYTSAPRGLKPGSSGFCTLAQTPDLPKDLASQLEGISHYRHLRVDDASGNPVAFSHSILTVGYGVHHVLSRIADSGLDHSGRSNFLAHHVAFDPEQLPDAGPAWLCEQRLFYQKWDRGAGLLPAERAMPTGRSEPRVCKQWMKLAGDAGWAGVLAAATNAAEPAYIVYEAGQDVLPLLEEAMALLPPEARWNVTFNTYFTGKAVRTTCQWRCVTADSPEARDAIAARRGVVLRIDQPMSGVPSGPLVEAARTGHVDRPAPRRRTAEPAPRPTEVNDLPESEPAMPAPRPIRTRPPEPEPDLGDSTYDMPLPPPRRSSSGKSGTGALILGLLLGAMLVLAATSLLEVIGGKSLLGFAGMKNADLEHARKEKEAAETLAAEKAAEATRERSSALAASHRHRDELNEKSRELDAALRNVETLEAKLKAVPVVPPPVAGGGGVFTSLANRVKIAKLVEDLKNANARAAKLQQELTTERAKASASPGRVYVSTVPIVGDLKPEGSTVAGIAGVNRMKAKLDIIGLLEPFATGKWDAGEKRASLIAGANSINFAIQDDGTIRFAHTVPPNDVKNVLQQILLRIDHGSEVEKSKRFEHVRFELPGNDGSPRPREVADSSDLNAVQLKKVDNTTTWVVRSSRLGDKLGSLAGRNARVRLGKAVYDLEVTQDKSEIGNRPLGAGPAITLSIKDREIVVSVKGSEEKPVIELLEVVRIIPPIPAIDFPEYEQELVRFYPFKK
jgi:hypothetical protein